MRNKNVFKALASALQELAYCHEEFTAIVAVIAMILLGILTLINWRIGVTIAFAVGLTIIAIWIGGWFQKPLTIYLIKEGVLC